MGIAEVFKQSISDPEAFWGEASGRIDWHRQPTTVLRVDDPMHPQWFAGGELNTCHNALDRHVRDGRAEQAALIHDSPLTGTTRTLTYAQLLDETARFAGVLHGLGVRRGDRVLVYMPMVPEAVVAMLACARLGAIHSVVFGGFAAPELTTRIDDARPKVVVSASCGIEPSRKIAYKPMLDQAIADAAAKPEHCVILQRPELPCDLVADRDVDWATAMASAQAVDCVPVRSSDPLYLLYTSGTTGVPKGVLRDNGGHAVALEWSMRNIYGMRPGEVFWAASDIGWVVGHSFIVYGPLLLGCTTVMYEGKPVGTPDANAFFRVAAQYGVSCMFTAPTALRAIKREDPGGELPAAHDLSKLRALFLAGERADPDTVTWAQRALKVPVIDHWWQTESGWPMAANCIGIETLPVKPGSPTHPVPGYDIRVVDPEGQEVAPGASGAIVVKQPMPPGFMSTLYENDARFIETYYSAFPGFYETGDAGFVDAEGYLFVMSRTDDIINVAGHRLSTGGIEGILATHPDVAECAVISQPDALKGEVPLALVVANVAFDRPDSELITDLVQLVRTELGPVAAFKHAVVVRRLPKTRSGKILRKTMRQIVRREPPRAPATIEDPVTLDEIAAALDAAGLRDVD